MTPQEIVDKVYFHLVDQGEPSYASGLCRYRMVNPHNLKVLSCAIGCLIPDEIYDLKMEGRTVESLISCELLPQDLAQEFFDKRLLLLKLQKIHDKFIIKYPVSLPWSDYLKQQFKQLCSEFLFYFPTR